MVGTQMKVLCNEARAAPASGWSSMGTNHTSGSVGIRTNGVPAGQSLNIDDVVVRRYVDAEVLHLVGVVDREERREGLDDRDARGPSERVADG